MCVPGIPTGKKTGRLPGLTESLIPKLLGTQQRGRRRPKHVFRKDGQCDQDGSAEDCSTANLWGPACENTCAEGLREPPPSLVRQNPARNSPVLRLPSLRHGFSYPVKCDFRMRLIVF